MANAAKHQTEINEPAAPEAAADQAVEACGGDPRATVKALFVANDMLERKLRDLYSKVSHGVSARAPGEV